MLGLVFRTLTSFQALHFILNKISNLLHACIYHITIDFCPFCYPVPNCTEVVLLEFISNQKQIKMGTSTEHRETCCQICLIGWKNSQKISWTKGFHLQGTYPQALLTSQIQNLREKWYRASIVFFLTPRKAQTARSAKRPTLQGAVAENA